MIGCIDVRSGQLLDVFRVVVELDVKERGRQIRGVVVSREARAAGAIADIAAVVQNIRIGAPNQRADVYAGINGSVVGKRRGFLMCA
jgi:hypothetical protein